MASLSSSKNYKLQIVCFGRTGPKSKLRLFEEIAMAACPNNTLGNRSPTTLEEKARLALEAVLERRMSDDEFQQARTRLIAFVNLLRGWELKRAGQIMRISELEQDEPIRLS